MRKKLFATILASLIISHASAQITTEALLDTIQHTAFKFFWQEANPSNGLIKDRSTSGSPSSIASVGFGLSAICIGVDRGWVSREAARDRVLTTLRTFWEMPQGNGATGYIGYKGWFYHFLDMENATRTWDSELSSIDTGLLLAGILDAKQYFNGLDSIETRIRALADSIYYRIDFNWMRNGLYALAMGWRPGTQFGGFGQWIGYNEAMILYILALGSPTHPIPGVSWYVWTSGYQWNTYFGQSYVIFPPLFGHQYSHCWVDFRNIQDQYMRDRGITYFENSRRATLAQRAYSIANPRGHTGYSDSLWGITASDYPGGYIARGAPPPENDDGTIAPTAPASSIPFAPEECIRVLRNMWNNYRPQLWTQYGFRDAFNLNVNWWGPDIIGINQGPMIIMIENYRNQRVWNRFMQNADIQRGLQRAGFQTVNGVEDRSKGTYSFTLMQNYPNPFNSSTIIRYAFPVEGHVTLRVFDVLGREVATLVNEVKSPGTYEVVWDATGMPSGVYYYRLKVGGSVHTKRMILLK